MCHAHIIDEPDNPLRRILALFRLSRTLDPLLQVDRLDQPRQHVAAGAVGIAGRQTGLYPNDGPGGWRLVARTPLKLFDPAATPPALLQPMQAVRFIPITLDQFEDSL